MQFSGGIIKPAAIELVSQSTFSTKVFTTHPYKNLVVFSWDREREYPLEKETSHPLKVMKPCTAKDNKTKYF